LQRLENRFHRSNLGEDAQHDVEAVDPDRMALCRQIGRTERRRLARSAIERRARQLGAILDLEVKRQRRPAQPLGEVRQSG
jgi:hypothetical protein